MIPEVSSLKVRNVVLGSMMFGLGVFASCGGEEATPTAEDLSRMLLTESDLEGEWVLFNGPQGGDEMVDPSGILTDQQRELVPSFDFCDKASDGAKEIAEVLRPQVFRQLDLTTDDEIDPPFDRSGHMIFVQQFLYADDPDEITESFDLVREGTTACFGIIPADEEGPGFAEELEVPSVGDDRFGALITIEEAGGWAEWHIQEVMFRQGAVLMRLVLIDIRAGDDPYFTTEEFGDLVKTAAAKL